MDIRFNVDIRNVVNALNDTAEEIITVATQELIKGAEKIVTDTKLQTPVDTGRLRTSYHADVIQADPALTEIEVFTDVEYAPFVEFGTSKQKAQPHFTTAVNANIGDIPMKIQSAIGKVIG